MFKGVVFDFDGVIVDSHPVHKRAWKKFLESVGVSVSEEQLQFVLDGRKRDDILRHFLGELSQEEKMEYGRHKEQLFREEAADVPITEGLLSFLEDLKDGHWALGIASSGSRNRIEFLLDRLRLKDHFQAVITGDQVDHGKPDPAIFLKAAQKLSIDPAQLVAFEDAVSGVKAAKSAGMICLGIASSHRAQMLLNAGADQVIPNFCSLSHTKLQTFF